MRSKLVLLLVLLSLVACRRHGTYRSHRGTAPISRATIATGAERSCAIVGEKLRCWGRVDFGGVGTPGTIELAPVDVPGTDGAVGVSIGSFACILVRDGTVRCWGWDGWSQISFAKPRSADVVPEPRAIPGLRDIVQVAAGSDHGCARRSDGRVLCWGGTPEGELGRGVAAIESAIPPAVVPGVDRVRDLAVGEQTSCAIREDGALFCWGEGYGATPHRVSGPPVRHVATTYKRICAVHVDGSVACAGRIGDDPVFEKLRPVEGLANMRTIVVGSRFACTIDDRRDVWCWGDEQKPQPNGLHDVVELSASRDHACARNASGEVHCWGSDNAAEVGDGRALSSVVLARPAKIDAPKDGLVVMGAHDDCIVSKGVVRCFQPRPPSDKDLADAPPRTPTVVPDLAGTTRLALARNHRCLIDGAGHVACKGFGRDGQLGFELAKDTYNVPKLTTVPELEPARDVVAGDRSTCASLVDGRVKCWGAGNAKPTEMPSLRDAISIAIGAQHACAVTKERNVVCWGAGATGQLGDGRIHATPVTAPIEVKGLSDVAEVRLADGHSCARTTKGEVSCWGFHFRGGMAKLAQKEDWDLAPVRVLDHAISLAVGRNHACVARDDGAVLCWGSNLYAQCGQKRLVNFDSPTIVEGVSSAKAVHAGEQSTCVETSAGELWCFGDEQRYDDGFFFGGSLHTPTPTKVPL